MADDAAAWRRVQWQTVTSAPLSPTWNLALDEALLESAVQGRRGPTLRFWEWSRPALVIGSHQLLENEVDLEAAASAGFALVRRMSGGGTMVVAPGASITYSLYAPVSLVSDLSLAASYAFFDSFAVQALRHLGVPASYLPLNDLVDPVGKMGGAAQARRRGWVLHHTTIAWSLDPELIPRLIRIGRPALKPGGLRSAEKRVSPLGRHLEIDRAQVVKLLLSHFARLTGASAGRVEPWELELAARLEAEKYSRRAWLERLG